MFNGNVGLTVSLATKDTMTNEDTIWENMSYNVLHMLTTDKKSLSMKLSRSSLFGHTSGRSAIFRRAIHRLDSNSPGDPVLVVPSSLT